MAKGMVLVLAASAVIGLVAGFAAGRLAGMGAFVAAALLGAIVVVLRRNQKDLRVLEAGLVHDEVDDALGRYGPNHERGSALDQE